MSVIQSQCGHAVGGYTVKIFYFSLHKICALKELFSEKDLVNNDTAKLYTFEQENFKILNPSA
jgi:hypothetical protein